MWCTATTACSRSARRSCKRTRRRYSATNNSPKINGRQNHIRSQTREVTQSLREKRFCYPKKRVFEPGRKSGHVSETTCFDSISYGKARDGLIGLLTGLGVQGWTAHGTGFC